MIVGSAQAKPRNDLIGSKQKDKKTKKSFDPN